MTYKFMNKLYITIAKSFGKYPIYDWPFIWPAVYLFASEQLTDDAFIKMMVEGVLATNMY